MIDFKMKIIRMMSVAQQREMEHVIQVKNAQPKVVVMAAVVPADLEFAVFLNCHVDRAPAKTSLI